MLFSNIIIFRIGAEWTPPSVATLEEALQRQAFTPCGPTQERAAGWVPPRGEDHGAMLETVDGQWILRLALERKTVPAAAVRTELKARCKAIEEERGRKPGKKERAEIKDEILLTFLPRAFARPSTHAIWLDVASRLLVVDAGSLKAAEPAVKLLVDLMAGLGHVMPLAPIVTQLAPATAMGEWLMAREAPASFTIDRDLELKKPGEERSVVRYARHTLDLEEIGLHIQQGKMPTRLALTWNDKVSFVLTDGLAIRKVAIREVEEAPDGEDAFDADVAITTGELSALLPDLLQVLGGELQVQQQQAGEQPAANDASPQYDQALQVVLANQKASISLVQRHLRIGYNAAARLLEEMERRGVVSAMDGSGQRRILEARAA